MVFKPGFNKGSVTHTQGTELKGTAEYYYELPTEWVLRSDEFRTKEHMWVVILKDSRTNYPAEMKPGEFAVVPRITEIDSGCQAFIQPIVRRYSYGELIEEFALGGNLTVRCDQDVLGIVGNKKRVPNKIRNLVCRQLGIGGPEFDANTYDEETFKKHFTVWDEKKIKMEGMKHAEMKKKLYPCTPHQGPARWARKGTDIVLQDDAMNMER